MLSTVCKKRVSLHKPNFTGSKRIDYLAVTIPILSNILIIFGAIRLNNFQNNDLTLTAYALIVAVFVFILFKHDKLKSFSIVSSLWLCGLGIILSGWLRSNYVSGPDISMEYEIYRTVLNSGYWSISEFKDAYNACLSVGLLTPVLSVITKLSGALVFKFVVPLIYSLLVPTVYLISRRFLSTGLSVAGTVFFMAQPAFEVWWNIPIRQEIAFFFFGLMILNMVYSKSHNANRVTLFLLFLYAVILTHYSTAYIAVILFILINITHSVLLRGGRGKNVKADIYIPSLIVIIMATVSVFAWYSQVTYGFNNVTGFIDKSINNLGAIFENDSQGQGQSFASQIDFLSKPGTVSTNYRQLSTEINRNAKREFGASNLLHGTSELQLHSPYPENSFFSKLGTLRQFIIVMSKLALLVGVVAISYISLKTKKLFSYSVLVIASIIFLVLSSVIPFFSIDYSQARMYQQLLIVMSGAIGGITLIKREKNSYRILSLFVVVYFFFSLSLYSLLFRNNNTPMNFNNYGEDYSLYYVHSSDYFAANWIAGNYDHKSIVADSFADYKLRLSGNASLNNRLWPYLVTSTIPKDSYVFSDYANLQTKTSFTAYQDGIITYVYPYKALNNSKNLVYSNSKDIVYN
ncbi:MAG TPA: DUF2206 domain-containing protein [Candidatus Sulfotelmatobacter sp.]|nr:DUF2206 domain-containing protein [Candidatus Sulfotelmatobacter sp.]